MKIILEREKCIGCGSCAALCPKYFEMAKDGKSTLRNSKKNPGSENFEAEIKGIDCAQDAADACPVKIIHIKK